MKTWRRTNKTARTLFLLLFAFLLAAWTAQPVRAGDVEDISLLPDWLSDGTEEPGELVEVIYPSVLGRNCRGGVYLPYGYNEAERYDVAFFLPGTGGNYMLALETAYPCFFESGMQRDISLRHILDRLIEEHMIRPTIVVCAEDIPPENFAVADADFRTLYAYVKENYSTYASDPEAEQAVYREHFAMLGFSRGAIYAQALGLGGHFDDFAYTGAVSFGDYFYALETVPQSPYEVGLLYVCSGTSMDKGAYSSRNNYEIIVGGCGDKLRDGENALRRVASRYGHSYSLAAVALYDGLPRMFPAEKQRLMALYYSGYSPRR